MMINLLQNNKTWITNAVQMRDEVTHYSDLEGLSCFLNRAWAGGDRAKIYYPSLPNRERVTKYMNETWNNIVTMIKNSYNIIDSIYS